MKIFKHTAFTLVELIATLAIIAVLVAVLVPFVGSMFSTAQQTRDKQTLAILNDALTRYKCEGGNVNALTASAPIASVIARLQADTTWAGLTHSFLQKGKTYVARSIYAKGEKAQYRFTKFNTYEAEAGGTSPTSLTNGLIAWWKLDQANGATDLSGNENNGTLLGGVTCGTVPNHRGQANGATSFDGADDYISIGNPLALQDLPNASFTVTGWYNGAYSYSGYILTKGTGTAGWRLNIDPARRINLLFERATTQLFVRTNTNSMPPANTWVHFAVVYPGGYNATNILVYSNGVQVSGFELQQSGAGAYLSDNSTNGRLMRSNWSAYMPGTLCDVRIYNRALSADEVLQLYNQ